MSENNGTVDQGNEENKVTNNKLTMKESYKLMQWLDSWRDLIASELWDIDKAIEQLLPKVLPVTGVLTEHNVRAAATELDPPITFAPRKRKTYTHDSESIEKKYKNLSNSTAFIKLRTEFEELALKCLAYKERIDMLEKKLISLDTVLERLLAELDMKRIGNAVQTIKFQKPV